MTDTPGGAVAAPPTGDRAAFRVWADALRLRWRMLPPWAHALLVFVATRLVTFVIVDRVARFQVESIWNPANPGYLDIVSFWDGGWYQRIAEGGYPDVLPRDEAGQVQQNQWAFYPLFPALARGVMEITGASWAIAATTVALLAGAAAAVVMRSLMAPLVGDRLALWTVILFCCYPASPVLQFAYTESVAVLLLVGVLWCLQRQRYLLALPLVLLVGFARPIGVPLAVVVGLHTLHALWRRRVDPVPPSRVAAMFATTAVAGGAALAWPVVAWLGTGERAAYTETMSAWRAGHEMHVLTPWITNSRYVLGYWMGPLALALCVVGLAVWVLARSSRSIGFDLQVWCLAYVGYLLAVLDPFTSLPRYLLLLFPLGALLASASRSSAYRWAIALAFLALQVVWVVWLWRFVPPTDWPP